jgi:hypothetical protein
VRAAVTAGGRLFDKTANRIEDVGERLARRDHLEESFFAGELSLRPPTLFDIDEQVKPAEDAPFRIWQGQPKDIEPPVDAVSAAMAALDVVRTTGLVCLRLRGDRVRKVVRVNDV